MAKKILKNKEYPSQQNRRYSLSVKNLRILEHTPKQNSLQRIFKSFGCLQMGTKKNNHSNKLQSIKPIWSNKKAFELIGNHAVNLVVAVLCVIVLVYAGVKVYGLFSDKSNMEKAKDNIKQVEVALLAVKDNVNKESSAIVLSPTDWGIIAWPYKDDFRKPSQCKENFCICICSIPSVLTSPFSNKEAPLDSCNSVGACTDSKIKINTWVEGMNAPIIIKKPPIELKFKYDEKNNVIDVTQVK